MRGLWQVLVVSLIFCHGVARADERERAEHEMERAHRAMDAHDFEGAIEHFEAARALAPESSGPWLGIGLANASLGRCGAAVPALEEYLRRKKEAPAPGAESTLAACRARLQAVVGTLHVESDPPGAEVRLDDERGVELGRTPLDLEMKVGPHPIAIVSPGFATELRTVAINGGQTTQLVVALRPAPPAPPPPVGPGRLQIHVEDGPAQVRINGGAPISGGPNRYALELPSGYYRIDVDKDGFLSQSRDLWIRGGMLQEEHFLFGPSGSTARHRAIIALAVIIPVVVVSAVIALAVIYSPSNSSSHETGFGTVDLP